MKLNKKILSSTFLIAMILTLTACGNQKSKSTDLTLSWSANSELISLDPAHANDTTSNATLINTGEGLYRSDKNNNPKLALAKSVKTSSDGKSYDFYLKKTKWSNGDPVTAKDFVYAYHRNVNPATKSQMGTYLSILKNASAITSGKKKVSTLGVSSPSKYHLHLELEKPVTSFSKYLTSPIFFPENSKFIKKVGKLYGTQAKYSISNGPFKVSKWNGTDKTWTMIKNDNYWDAKNVNLKKIKEQYNPTPSTSYNLYQDNQLDEITLNSEQFKANQHNKNVHTYPTYGIMRLDFNQQSNSVLRNLKIRQAFSAAINRQDLVKLSNNQNSIATGLVPNNIGKNPTTGTSFSKDSYVKNSTTYDLKRAKKLWRSGLQEINQKKLHLTLLVNDTSAASRTGELLQSNLEKLPGLTISLAKMPPVQVKSRIINHNYQLSLITFTPIVADPSNVLVSYTQEHFLNPGYNNSTFNALMTNATNKNANKPKAQYEDLVKAEKILMQTQATVPLTQVNTSVLVKNNIHNYHFMPLYGSFDFKSTYIK